MATYKLKAPFMTRAGQFEKGKQTLAVGVLESVLLQKTPGEVLKMTIGRSKTIYSKKCEDLKNARHTIWTNPQGKRVRIIPVSEFNVKLPTSPKEPETPKQDTLL